MTATRHRSSPPDAWTLPRPHRDPAQRFAKYGAIRPLGWTEAEERARTTRHRLRVAATLAAVAATLAWSAWGWAEWLG